jgi:hypothetical protein
MGFLDNNTSASTKSSGNLDLVDYESSLIKKFNDDSILNQKYMAEDFGIFFDKHKMKSDVYLYDNSEKIIICPEPLEFLKDFDDVSDNTKEADKKFREKIAKFQRIELDHIPKLKGNSVNGERMWMNKTLTGINLRPGNLNNDRDKFDPIRMCDDNVHGLIAGRTGSGKSVFINALILSLITEYPPWELNLYLADFKKVELSRYMNNADEANGNTPFTPHVNACAATSEIRYVVSLIKYLVDCMNARQEFFARLGVTKIQEFRNKYGLVLPRVLLIVDEFQQLFIEATNRERDEVQTMLNSITKLGRATGFHLVFASQEMSGTLGGNTLANFKIRMCLPCTQQISADILGNSQAVNLERGYVLINTDSGDELKNQKYRVPFIETDKKDDDDDSTKTPFYAFLDEIKLASKNYKLELRYKTLTQKFYREELQENENAYLKDLDDIQDRKNKKVSENHALFDAVVLGKTVLYSPKPNDKVSFYIEKGRNKGIMIACSEPDNAARIRKLLTENLIRSNEETYHFGMELNNLVWERYPIGKAISKSESNTSKIHKYFRCDIDSAVENLELMYYLRVFSQKYVDNNTELLSATKSDEEKLSSLRKDPSKVEEYDERKKKRQELQTKIEDLDRQISELSKENNKKSISPIIKYLEKCSSTIVVVPADNTKADFIELNLYKKVVTAFSENPDIVEASRKSVEILTKHIEALTKRKFEDEKEKVNNDLAIYRNKVFKRSILFFADKYEGNIPEKKKLTPTLEEIFVSFEKAVKKYKDDYQKLISVAEQIKTLSDERQNIQDKLTELEETPNELEDAEERCRSNINSFVKYTFESAYTAIGKTNNKSLPQEIDYSYEDGSIKWTFNGGELDENIQVVALDALDWFVARYRGENKPDDFKKIVFWINGLDMIEKIPYRLEAVIRNAINQNILVISIITSELTDTLIRKAFDYVFITGNIEKFYDMFNIRYTKQPLDSIVVNFGVISKGFDIPFKMYKSNLEEIQAPNFIDDLLNA